jgi:hypothetical protein
MSAELTVVPVQGRNDDENLGFRNQGRYITGVIVNSLRLCHGMDYITTVAFVDSGHRVRSRFEDSGHGLCLICGWILHHILHSFFLSGRNEDVAEAARVCEQVSHQMIIIQLGRVENLRA